MADCNDLFAHFNRTIRLGEDKRQILRTVRDNLRTKMLSRFIDMQFDEQLEFHSQGSFVMDTIIVPKDDDFDLDDGVYFLGSRTRDNRPPVEDFHNAVLYAVGSEEDYAEVTDKDTCVRVAYKREKFHIDLPIYYANSTYDPDLAHLTEEWMLSNPIEFIEWFEQKTQSGFQKSFILETRMYSQYTTWLSDIRKEDAQLRRIVRYLKVWGDELRGDMPPGIIMTILAANNYVSNVRDDVSLRDTLVEIEKFLRGNGFKCPRPTTPKGEDLFLNYGETRKNYFRDRLSAFVNSANQAIESNNQKDACLKWQRHLGWRFPCSLAQDRIVTDISYDSQAVLGSTARSASNL